MLLHISESLTRTHPCVTRLTLCPWIRRRSVAVQPAELWRGAVARGAVSTGPAAAGGGAAGPGVPGAPEAVDFNIYKGAEFCMQTTVI